MSSRSQKPTPRREQEARRRGDVPRSRLFGAAGAMLGALLGAGMSWPGGVASLRRWTLEVLGMAQPATATGATSTAVLLVGGWHFDLAQVGPRMDRLRPFRQLARRFTPGALLEAVRPPVLLALLGLGALLHLHGLAPHVLRAAALGGEGLGGLLPHGSRLVMLLALATAAVGCADALVARVRHRGRLRMTREEVLEEQRLSEGDPRQRARRRALHRSLLLAGRARGIRSASALVVNPTHLAVALRYAPREAEAPFLVAKGAGFQAQELRREARRWGIPVVRDVALARSLTVFDVGEEIPEDLYQAAAAVLQVAASAPGGAC